MTYFEAMQRVLDNARDYLAIIKDPAVQRVDGEATNKIEDLFLFLQHPNKLSPVEAEQIGSDLAKEFGTHTVRSN